MKILENIIFIYKTLKEYILCNEKLTDSYISTVYIILLFIVILTYVKYFLFGKIHVNPPGLNQTIAFLFPVIHFYIFISTLEKKSKKTYIIALYHLFVTYLMLHMP